MKVLSSVLLLLRRFLSNKPRAFLLLAALVCLVVVAEYARQIPLVADAKDVEHPLQGEALTLLTMGDWGKGNEGQRTTAALLERLCEERRADAVVLLGDNFYPRGVKSTTDPYWNDRWRALYSGPCLSRIPFYAALGNHDYDGNPSAQIRYSRVEPGRWVMPARAFTVRFGNLLTLTNIDTNFPDVCGLPALCSLDWLERSLARFPATWKIAFGHHPAMGGKKYPRLKPFARRTVPPFLCRNDFDMYWSGHEHVFLDIEGRNEDLPCDIRQLVMGGGGAEVNPVAPAGGQVKFSLSALGVGVARVERTRVGMEFVRAPDGAVVHSFALEKPQGDSAQ
jgi:tartrate-resistant acid phosphatase type 5